MDQIGKGLGFKDRNLLFVGSSMPERQQWVNLNIDPFYFGERSYEVQRRIIVCCDTKSRTTEDGIKVMPAEVFAQKLWLQELF